MNRNFRYSVVGSEMNFENLSNGWKSKAYDEIGPVQGQYMKTRNGKYYGFITIFRDVCEPKYIKIPSLYMLNIYGFTQVQDEMGWTIINETGTEIFKKRFKGIYIVNEELVVLEEFNGFIKLYFPQHKCVTQEDFTDIEPDKNFVRTFYGQNEGIYLYDGTCILKARYKSALPFGKDTFKGITDRDKEIVNKKGWENPSAEAERIFPETRGFFRAENIEYCPLLSRKFAFISGETGEYITGFDFSEAKDFDKSGIAIVRDCVSNKIKALEPSGKVREAYFIQTPAPKQE